MLKISITEAAHEMRLTVHGCLVGPWVGELRRSWTKMRQGADGRECIVDLNDVTYIDKTGTRLLRAMFKQGAQFRATGVYTKDVLQQVTTRRLGGLFRFMSCFLASLLLTVTTFALLGSQPSNPIGIRTYAVRAHFNKAHYGRRGVASWK